VAQSGQRTPPPRACARAGATHSGLHMGAARVRAAEAAYIWWPMILDMKEMGGPRKLPIYGGP
jgi:hypothetical protein